MTKISIRSGREGSRHDPYHYDEITVERHGHVYCLHLGLSVSLEIDGTEVVQDLKEVDRIKLFTELTGASPAEWERWFHALKQVCHTCGKRTKTVTLGGGFAGETLYGCAICESIKYDDFHIGMIE